MHAQLVAAGVELFRLAAWAAFVPDKAACIAKSVVNARVRHDTHVRSHALALMNWQELLEIMGCTKGASHR
jgi:hypothetical protein